MIMNGQQNEPSAWSLLIWTIIRQKNALAFFHEGLSHWKMLSGRQHTAVMVFSLLVVPSSAVAVADDVYINFYPCRYGCLAGLAQTDVFLIYTYHNWLFSVLFFFPSIFSCATSWPHPTSTRSILASLIKRAVQNWVMIAASAFTSIKKRFQPPVSVMLFERLARK